MDVMTLVTAVTVKGNGKRESASNHFVRRMIVDEIRYQIPIVTVVRINCKVVMGCGVGVVIASSPRVSSSEIMSISSRKSSSDS